MTNPDFSSTRGNQLANRSQNFFNKHGQQQFAPLLSEFEKRDLAETGSPFTVLKVRETTTDKFGAAWALDIDWFGQVRGIMFTRGGANVENRDTMLTALAYEVEQVGPVACILTVTVTKAGNEFYNLAAPSEEQLAMLDSGTDEVPF